MFVIPAIAALLTFVYLRPHEVVELLRPLTLAGVVGIVGYTYVLDLRLGRVRPRGSPMLYLLLALLVLCVFTIVVRAPDRLTDQFRVVGPSMLVFLAVSEGIQSFRALEAAAIIVVVLTIFLAIVGVHQGLQPFECFMRTGHVGANAEDDLADGRPCTRRAQCEEGGVTGADYLCEHPGLMGTHSDGGRVRYRGLLQDPNELCMAFALGMPLAFGLYERRRTWLHRLLVFAILATAPIGEGTAHATQYSWDERDQCLRSWNGTVWETYQCNAFFKSTYCDQLGCGRCLFVRTRYTNGTYSDEMGGCYNPTSMNMGGLACYWYETVNGFDYHMYSRGDGSGRWYLLDVTYEPLDVIADFVDVDVCDLR